MNEMCFQLLVIQFPNLRRIVQHFSNHGFSFALFLQLPCSALFQLQWSCFSIAAPCQLSYQRQRQARNCREHILFPYPQSSPLNSSWCLMSICVFLFTMSSYRQCFKIILFMVDLLSDASGQCMFQKYYSERMKKGCYWKVSFAWGWQPHSGYISFV